MIFRQKKWEKIEEYTWQLFISAALAGLVINGTQSDVIYARKYLLEPPASSGLLSGPRYRKEAVELLARFAEKADSETLRQIVAESYPPMRQIAARALLKLAHGVNEMSRQLLSSTDHEISSLTMESLARHGGKTARKILEDCLKNDDDSTRLTALKVLTRRMNRRDLEALLERYIAKCAYFYDVICWIDRLLYAPQPLRAAYREQLESKYS